MDEMHSLLSRPIEVVVVTVVLWVVLCFVRALYDGLRK